MDFFAATREHSAAPAPVAVAAAGHGVPDGREPTTTMDHNAPVGVAAFAEAINARYSRAGTSLIPLSPNQHGSTTPNFLPATPPSGPARPVQAQPFTLTMPARPAALSPAPLLSLHPPPPPHRSSPLATAASPPPPAAPADFRLSLPTLPSLPATSASSQPLPPSAFTALSPNALQPVLGEPSILILDIRPHNVYANARLPSALSLSVPSTLLKRPLFSLDRLAQMLSPSTRARFSAWPTASKILVYDADSTTLAEGGNILGLLRKLRKEGYAGELCWVKGGFKAVWREQFDLVDQSAPVEEEDEEGELPSQAALGAPAQLHQPAANIPGVEMSKTMSAPPTMAGFPQSVPPSMLLRTKKLPMSAFTSSTTTSSRPYPGSMSNLVPATPLPSRGDPFAAATILGAPSGTMSTSMSLPGTARSPSVASTSTIPEGKPLHAFPPRLGVIPNTGPLARSTDTASSLPTQGAGAAYGLAPRERQHHKSFPGVVGGQSVAFNPFFDTIRQNLELGGGRGAGEGIPLRLSRRVRRRVGDLPFEWLREIARRSGHVSDESLSSDKVEYPAAKPLVISLTDNMQSETDSDDNSATTRPSRRERTRKKVAGLNGRDDSPATSSPPASSPDGEGLAKSLAMQFYKIELGEQRRLMGVMEHHSMESGDVVDANASAMQPMVKSATVGGFTTNRQGIPSGGLCGPMPTLPAGPPIARDEKTNDVDQGRQTYPGTVAARMLSGTASEGGVHVSRSAKDRAKAFPFSITAGVEKGDKNRYRNIWPFEHARVRLHKSRPEDDDYMNASYVRPLGTKKRYIATQGPLPSTFTDFWMLCWQENVHVIVMLTREVESALVKCGNYWQEGEYGPLRLKVVSTNDTPERENRRRESEMASGFFNVPQARAAATDTDDHTIRRVFELTHTGYPSAPPRTVIQLQYLDWPDLDVPKDPRGLLDLMQEVDDAVDSTRGDRARVWGEGPLRGKSGSKNAAALSDSRPQAIQTVESMDDLDAETGVAKHAIDNPPVLLHCSAGVGRTGGFIAVDAILDGLRREMRKRREEKGALDKLSSGSGSPVPSTARGSSSPVSGDTDDAMEVDSRSVASASPARKDSALPDTVSASAGDLPPAADPSPADDMDVDVEASPKRISAPSASRRVLQPSTDLIDEVRRSHLQRSSSHTVRERDFVSSPSPIIRSPAPHVLSPRGNRSETASSLSGSMTSGRRSTSTLTSESRSGTSPVGSSAAGSTTSLNAAAKSMKLSEPQAPSAATAAVAGSTVATEAAVRAVGDSSSGKAQRVLEHARLDSWRTNVSDSGTHHTTDNQPTMQTVDDSVDEMPPTPRNLAFDYTSPRPLDDAASPPLLSSYNEPIRRVIEDMREQRMSLCQSLRQYVFVHRAIIEGALMIVDEEKKREDAERLAAEQEAASKDTGANAASEARPTQTSGVQAPKAQSPSAPRATFAFNLDRGKDAQFPLHAPVPRGAPLADVLMDDDSLLQPPPAIPSPRSKRQASPTELVQETLKGEARLNKRPSVKRRGQSTDEAAGGLTAKSIALASPHPSDKS
ncbi:tyrosine protein phosphatase domain-containing protein [Phanerochaete sordida]|uniref:protein-tyrosine-phosphatase n=1 Tax=Phanerochaete sordida TaxID=48140 RepID=A0A9P3GM90_9APHY|nr:tyrosine protein phosphatase domain-containing protein [Phanerochaete sordida]